MSSQDPSKSAVLAPLSTERGTFGCLSITSSERVYNASDLEVVEELARKISLIIDNARLYEGNAFFSVRDEGNGIAKEHQMRIFNRFERAASDAENSGLGLGLFIVEEIVGAHHGVISLESEVGQGSTFTVEIPL